MSKDVNILIVDDQVGMLETITDILQDKGYNAETAEDGYTAIDKVKRQPFDVIFMDIKMPGINGVQTFREIKKINPKTAVIMMTAYSVENLVKEAIEEGAYAVIYKPFEIERVVETIERVLKTILVLIVDDRYEDRENLKDILEDKGYKVIEADSGYKAIELVKKGRYNIILLDIKMPDIDGVKTFEEIHRINPNIPVIMVTGYSAEELVQEALNKGAYACITKPFDVEKILGAVEDAIKNKA